MKKILFILVIVFSVGIFSCTQNQRAKIYGGTIKLDLPVGEKLVTATWKQDNFWYLTRKMRPDEKPETYYFKESSNFGIVEGKVIIIEHK